MSGLRAAARRRALALLGLTAAVPACGELLGADEFRFDRVASGGLGGSAAMGGAGSTAMGGVDSTTTGGADSNAASAAGSIAKGGSGSTMILTASSGFGPTQGGGTTSPGGAGGTRDDESSGGQAAGAGGSLDPGSAGLGGQLPDPSGGSGGSELPDGPLIPMPATYQYYCSAASGKAWALFFNRNQPCAYIRQSFTWGSPESVQRAGIFDPNGRNNVVVRCADVVGAATFTATGAKALDYAYEWATEPNTRQGCVFTVAPARLPIFRAPFSLNRLPPGFTMSNRAYDFASVPGHPGPGVREGTLDVTAYSQIGLDPSRCADPFLGCARIVSYRGEDRSGFPEGNDSQGFDWKMDVGVPILAMADGRVIAKRTRAAPECEGGAVNELYVRHVVAVEASSPYAEIFIAYYAHLSFVPGIEVGSVVHSGQTVGLVGATGCTGGEGLLHLSVIRASNTATDYRPALDTMPGIYGVSGRAPDNSVARIDPYGWMASQTRPNVDPGGFKWLDTAIPFMGPAGETRQGGGALSVSLWREGEAPPRPCDRNTIAWPAAIGALINPYARCDQ